MKSGWMPFWAALVCPLCGFISSRLKLDFVGEMYENIDEICGVACNIRSRGNRVCLWTSDSSNKDLQITIGRQFKHLVGVEAEEKISYLAHSDAKKMTNSNKARDLFEIWLIDRLSLSRGTCHLISSLLVSGRTTEKDCAITDLYVTCFYRKFLIDRNFHSNDVKNTGKSGIENEWLASSENVRNPLFTTVVWLIIQKKVVIFHHRWHFSYYEVLYLRLIWAFIHSSRSCWAN